MTAVLLVTMAMQLLPRTVQGVHAVTVALSRQFVTTLLGFASVNPMSLEITVIAAR